MTRTYAYILTAAAGASGVVNAVQVPDGLKLKLKEVKVHFPGGSNFLLKIRILHGNERVCPEENYLAGDNVVLEVPCDKVYQSQEYFRVEYVNEDASNAHKALIVFVCEVV